MGRLGWAVNVSLEGSTRPRVAKVKLIYVIYAEVGASNVQGWVAGASANG